jgi:uncharacterized membrane protein
MEVCILKFDGSNTADDALKQVANAEADRNRWLHEVGVVKRPLLGRISIRVTFADDQTAEVREGDIRSAVAEAGSMTGYLVGSLVGPLHAELAASESGGRARAVGKAVEKMLAPFEEIKSRLPRDSSALVLVATPAINDRMVALFAAWSPEVIRKDVEQEVERRLEAFRQKTIQDLSAQAAAHH